MIAVECFPDTALLNAIGVPLDRIIHARGRGNVLNDLLQGRSGAGLIDEDPNGRQNPQLQCFEIVDRAGSLIKMICRNRPDRELIIICPRLEEWLLLRAAANVVKPWQYGLPETPRELHRRRRYDRLPGFRDFVLALLAVDAEMQALKKWLAPKW